ncbi:hypothetical protein TRFO_03086 [Tritrichomonas foetus]|uniref:Vacuolar sorting protein 39/Transforming growth factor beta receptor-associated zinc finger domain-containing protein n=1 Tax=Tritrichomonas foetus TaxID=1144522 RepID=A0A1J4KYK7_9EUKA|nr:hypothetical protein TRFO_03086 [Tritrichomonas foetus]|eukprot:OHT14790.1 hypothetical protein TRFO_03086 [Tritrichomonas foetus]
MSLTPHSIQCPIDPSFVKGICEFRNTIYVAYPQSMVFPLVYNSQSSGSPYEAPTEQFRLTFEEKIKDETTPTNYTIHNMFSIQSPELMILHYYKLDKEGNETVPSKVVVVPHEIGPNEIQDELDSLILCDNCSIVGVSFQDERKNDDENIYPLLVTANGKKFTVYRLEYEEGKSQTADDYFKPFITKDTQSLITAIAVTKNAVCFYGNSKYRTYWFQNDSFAEVSSIYVEHPFCFPLTDDNFLLGNPKSMIVSGKLGEKSSNSINYNKGYENLIPANRPRDIMIYQNQIYQFFEQGILVGKVDRETSNSAFPFKLVSVPKVKFGCQRYDLADIFLLTDDEMLTLGGVSYGSRLATRALESGIDVALTCVQRITNEKDQMDVMVDMFKDLWVRDPNDPMKGMKDIHENLGKDDSRPSQKVREKYANAKVYAMRLVSNVLWRADAREILMLFPVIMLSIPLEKRELLHGTQPIEEPSKELLQELGKFLLFTSDNYKISNDSTLTAQLPVIDTALFEFYAIHHKTRELDNFMRDQNSIDLQLIVKFFQENQKKMRLYPAYAIFNTRTDKPQEALNIWRTLDARDPSHTGNWALEASYTLREISSPKILNHHLSWVKARDISSAVNAFLYPKVDVEFAVNWIKENCKEYLVKFYDYLTTQTDTPPKQNVIESVLKKFCKLLKNMALPGFDVHLLTYNPKAIAAKGQQPKDVIDLFATELANKIARIIRTIKEPKDYNFMPYVEIIREAGSQHKWLLFEFFQIGEMYDLAMDVIFTGKANFKELEDFCRNSPNPDIAFNVAFSRMIKDGKDVLANNADFLIRNMEWVNFEEMLDWIPDNIPLHQIDSIIQTASTYLIQKERFMTLKNDIAISMKKEADYKLIQARLRNVEIQHQTVCQACQRPVGNGWVAVAPDNRVYHITCKPKLAPRK